MTREETVKWIKEHRSTDMECKHDEAMRMAIRALEQEPFDIETYCKEHFCVMVDKDVWKKAEKALKENSILDKIRAEIEQLTSRYSISKERGGMGQVEWSDRLIKESDVLQILDKYRGESGCHECKIEHDCYKCEKYEKENEE